MNIMILFLAVVVALCVWWLLLQRLTAKPWLETGIPDTAENPFPVVSAKLGLYVFLAVITSLFCLFATAYAMRMHTGDWRPLPEPGILWVNTAVLVASSFTLQGAVSSTGRTTRGVSVFLLVLGGALAIAFVAGQLWAWRQLQHLGYTMQANPAYAFFYLITGLHGIHLLGGLWVWTRTLLRLGGGATLSEVRLSMQLCAQYWHYLLLIWLLLFALLLRT